MKYLRLFEELNIPTYLSAADKLRDGHPKRAEALRKWAELQSGIKVDRIFAHKFKIDLDPVEEFEITDSKLNMGSFNRRIIEVYLSSHITNIVIEFRWEPLPENANDFVIRVYEEEGIMSLWKNFDKDRRTDTLISINGSRKFLFGNRRDAVQLKRFLIEEYSNNKEILEGIKNININDLYESK